MTEQRAKATADSSMDINNMFKEEVFTDRRIGTIHVLTPVLASGEHDTQRKTLYMGETQIRTPAGPLPINFEIDAQTLGEAAEKFGDAAQQGAEQTMRQIEEMQREQANKIVIPGANEMAGFGGGNIQIP